MAAQSVLAVVLILVTVSPIAAQTVPPPTTRADVMGTIAWLNVHKEDERAYDDWYNRSLYGGIVLGGYWTDHLTTEAEFGGSTRAELYRAEQLVIDGELAFVSSELTFSTTRVAVGQRYQFFRNAWLHPHVTAGIDLTWERRIEDVAPVVLFNSQSRQSRLVREGHTIGPETVFAIRPFGEVGFKLYMTRRAFFRSDVRLVVRGGLEEVSWRFGLGADF